MRKRIIDVEILRFLLVDENIHCGKVGEVGIASNARIADAGAILCHISLVMTLSGTVWYLH